MNIGNSGITLPPSHNQNAPTSQIKADDQLDLEQVFSVLWIGKRIIIFCTFVASVLGVYYAVAVAESKFAASTQMALQVNKQQVVDIQSVVSGVSTEEQAINTELRIIMSRTLILELIREMNLTEDPEFNERLQDPPLITVHEILAFASNYIDIPLVEPSVPTHEELELEVVKSVSEAIVASSEPNTYLLQIRVRTWDPLKSAEMANRLARIYLDDQIRVKFTETEFAVDWLSERVTQLEQELNEKEDSIKNLRAETDLISLDALEALNIRAKDIRERLADTSTAAINAAAKSERIATLSVNRDFARIAAEYNFPTLTRLAEQAQTGGNVAEAAFFAELETIQATAAENLDRVVSQRDALQRSYDLIQQEIEVQNADLVRLNQLVRESEAIRVLYETFLTRLKETSVQIGLQRADSRILSEAVPGAQVAPQKSLILAMSVVLGGMLGVGIVMLRSMAQHGFRSAEDLERITGYTVLGQIPIMPFRRRLGLLDYLRTKPTSAANEAIRNLRTSILLSNIDTPPKVIMSTSSIPGEGKTTHSIALAQNLSGLDKKVLLIEADIRRRTFDQYFTGKPQGNLVSVVSDGMELADAILSEDGLGIDVLMGGKSAINAADFFSSDKFKAFIKQVRESYDFVIIDTPPVLVVPDARVIGHNADAILYTVKWDFTNQNQVVDGLRQFSSVGLRVAGLALSQINPRGMKRYGYGGRYGAYASYGKGYYDA
jgi:capsular exopolysaccharide synthesis family protein